MNIAEFLREVAVAAFVHDMKAGDERHIGNCEVYRAICDASFLKSLHLHLCVWVEQGKNAACGVVNLHSMNVTAFADFGRHQSDDVTNTGRTLYDVTALEAESLCNIPHGINDRRRSVVGAVAAHDRSFVFFGSKYFAESLVDRIRRPCASLIESRAKTTPTTITAQDFHFFGSGRFAGRE